MKNKEIRFQFASIELLNFNLNHPGCELPPNRTYLFETQINTSVNLDKKHFIILPKVNVVYEADKSIHASMQVSFAFAIDNLLDFKQEGQIDLPENIVVMLISISISTLRGIMYSQFRGTFLNNVIMPIIDPKSFVKKVED